MIDRSRVAHYRLADHKAGSIAPPTTPISSQAVLGSAQPPQFRYKVHGRAERPARLGDKKEDVRVELGWSGVLHRGGGLLSSKERGS